MVAAVKSPGGLNQAVARIRSTVGPHVGVRNSFSKLYRAEGPDELLPVDQWRAWLLLTAVGEDPAEWGITSEDMPELYMSKPGELRELLLSPLPDSNRRVSLYIVDGSEYSWPLEANKVKDAA